MGEVVTPLNLVLAFTIFESRVARNSSLFGLVSTKSSSSLSSELIAWILSTRTSGATVSLSSSNCCSSRGSEGVNALRPWIFSLSGKVSLTIITLDPSDDTSTLGLGKAFFVSPPPGLRMMFISMFLLSNTDCPSSMEFLFTSTSVLIAFLDCLLVFLAPGASLNCSRGFKELELGTKLFGITSGWFVGAAVVPKTLRLLLTPEFPLKLCPTLIFGLGLLAKGEGVTCLENGEAVVWLPKGEGEVNIRLSLNCSTLLEAVLVDGSSVVLANGLFGAGVPKSSGVTNEVAGVEKNMPESPVISLKEPIVNFSGFPKTLDGELNAVNAGLLLSPASTLNCGESDCCSSTGPLVVLLVVDLVVVVLLVVLCVVLLLGRLVGDLVDCSVLGKKEAEGVVWNWLLNVELGALVV